MFNAYWFVAISILKLYIYDENLYGILEFFFFAGVQSKTTKTFFYFNKIRGEKNNAELELKNLLNK